MLDEIGRGTSTYDGLSIAWAVAEHLHDVVGCRGLFATHYHELTDLADSIPGVVNYHVVVREYKDEIVFLRKVVPGRSDRSYGIQVARLAGMPNAVVNHARHALASLEAQQEASREQVDLFAPPPDDASGTPSAVEAALSTLDPDAMQGWAAQNGMAGRSYEEVVTSDTCREMVQGYVDELNLGLNRWEQIKKFTILEKDLTVEEGELTPSLKVKRKVVEKKYATLLDKMYEGAVADS